MKRTTLAVMSAAAVGAAIAYLFRHRWLTAEDLLHDEPPPAIGDASRGGPPAVIPLPSGWRYASKATEVPQAAVKKANDWLYHSKMGEFYDSGSGWALIKEYHFDNHVSKVAKWHPGISVLLPVGVS